MARAPAENKHVARHAASLLVPQEHGLRGDGPSPDINHEASLGPKPPDEVAEDAGEHVSRDAASLLVPQEDGLRGDGPPAPSTWTAAEAPAATTWSAAEKMQDAIKRQDREAIRALMAGRDRGVDEAAEPPSTTFTTGANVPGPTKVDKALRSLSAAIEAIGCEAFASEAVTSTLESQAVAYRSKELMKVDPRSSDEMRVLCAAQDGLSASLLEQDLEEPLPLAHIKMAYAEWRANDVCLEDLLRGLTRKVEREKDSPSSRQIHVQCLSTLNECFKHVASRESRYWFRLVTTKEQRVHPNLTGPAGPGRDRRDEVHVA